MMEGQVRPTILGQGENGEDSKSTIGFPNRGKVCPCEQPVAVTRDKRLNPMASGRRGWKSHGESTSEPDLSVGCSHCQLTVSNTQSLQHVCSHKCSRDLRWSEARKESRTTAVIKNSESPQIIQDRALAVFAFAQPKLD